MTFCVLRKFRKFLRFCISLLDGNDIYFQASQFLNLMPTSVFYFEISIDFFFELHTYGA